MDRLTREFRLPEESGSESASQPELWDGRPGAPIQAPANDRTAEDRSRWLARTIEADIIPRLMLAHYATREAGTQARNEAARTPPGQAEVAEFAQIALDVDPSAVARYVDTLRNEGVELDVIYMELLAPAARWLGELWEADLCDFAEVTLGLWRIQQVMYDLSPAFHKATPSGSCDRRALLTPVPNSQHTFGLLMVSEFFRRAGWDVWARTAVSAAEIVNATREEWFDVCGLSIGAESQIPAVAAVILEIRAQSRNPALVVMIGGPIVVAQPGIVHQVGADGTAADAAGAVVYAEEFVKSRARLS